MRSGSMVATFRLRSKPLPKGLPDGSDPIRGHGTRDQVLAIRNDSMTQLVEMVKFTVMRA